MVFIGCGMGGKGSNWYAEIKGVVASGFFYSYILDSINYNLNRINYFMAHMVGVLGFWGFGVSHGTFGTYA